MSYAPHIWVDRELISDDKLNHIENGIYDEEQRATQAEAGIASDLASEVTRASSAEALLAPQATTYTKTEVDNLLSQFETNIDWKEAVNTYADIATTYPNPVDGWTVNVKDTDYTYRYNGTVWVAISANAIPVATDSTNGLLSALLHAKLNGIDTMHGATSLLDGTSGLTPAPEAGDHDKFLRGDGTWAVPTGEADMTGATASKAGTHGLVPAPSAGDQDKVLKGDGTWGTLSSAGHAIWNKVKAILTTRPALWFKDAYVTDDSTNLSTNVEVIQTVTESAFDALATTADGLYDVDDGQTVPLMADNVGFDNTGTDMSATDVDGAIKELNAGKLGDFTTTSDVTISGVTYHTYWEVAPTASNQVYGVAVHPTNGKLYRIYNNKGTYTAVSYDANTTTGDGIKTKVAKTGTAQSAITSTISAGTTLDNAIGTLLNNDATLNADITTLNVVTYSENASYPSGSVAVRERAGVVSLNVTLQILSADMSIGWTKIGTVSAHPIVEQFLPCFNGATAGCIGYAYLKTNGELHLHGFYAKNGVIPVICGVYFT